MVTPSPFCTPSSLRGIPKVPSLLFDMEMEDGVKAVHSAEELDVDLVESELRRFLRPSSHTVVQLTQVVDAGIRQQVGRAQPVDASSLAHCLTSSGYSVRVRRAVGGGEGSSCLHNLRHTFLCVTCPGDLKASFVVDPSFAEQFEIAKPTQRYSTILSCLPAVLVIPEDRIPPLVTFLCAELMSAFKASNTVVPPWRQASSMLSKWQPRKSLDLNVDRSMPLLLGSQLQQQQVIQRVSDIGGASAGGNVAAGLLVAASCIKPLPLEPTRVYGGFGYMNMAS